MLLGAHAQYTYKTLRKVIILPRMKKKELILLIDDRVQVIISLIPIDLKLIIISGAHAYNNFGRPN